MLLYELQNLELEYRRSSYKENIYRNGRAFWDAPTPSPGPKHEFFLGSFCGFGSEMFDLWITPGGSPLTYEGAGVMTSSVT